MTYNPITNTFFKLEGMNRNVNSMFHGISGGGFRFWSATVTASFSPLGILRLHGLTDFTIGLQQTQQLLLEIVIALLDRIQGRIERIQIRIDRVEV